MNQLNQQRNQIAQKGCKVRFVTGLGCPENERIQHTGVLICPLWPDDGWMAKSDQTGETWALKQSEEDWELLD